MPPLAVFFIVASCLWAAVSAVLSVRQVAHVQHHRNAVPAEFAAHVSLADHQKAADYTVARERFARVGTVLDLALSLSWVLGGIGLLYSGVATVAPPSLWRGVLFLLAVGATGTILHLPLDLYAAFGLEQRFGFNRRTLGGFIADRLKQSVLSLVIATPLLFALLWAMRSFSGLWWLWAWAGIVVLMIVAPAFYVRVVAPRFNRFVPLAGPLRNRIEDLLARSGFRSSGLFVMDASRRTAHGNAYFIGFGRTKRIVLFDTLIERSAPDEIEAVIAHELGHFRHRHVLFGLLRAAAMAFVGLAAFGWLCRQSWFLPAFGVDVADDAVSLYVCLLLGAAIGPLMAPIGNWISRRNEFQADDYARRAVGAGAMISALTGLARDNASTLTPDPVYALMHYSHPPVPVRVRHLRDAGPQSDGLAAA